MIFRISDGLILIFSFILSTPPICHQNHSNQRSPLRASLAGVKNYLLLIQTFFQPTSQYKRTNQVVARGNTAKAIP
jgi:hypothetical protein